MMYKNVFYSENNKFMEQFAFIYCQLKFCS